MTETKRDLTADLAICEAATAGDDWTNFCPVNCEYTTYVSEYDRLTEEPVALIAECERVEDATFIAEARTGWPHAIQRAIKAEAYAARLHELLDRAAGCLMRSEFTAECYAALYPEEVRTDAEN